MTRKILRPNLDINARRSPRRPRIVASLSLDRGDKDALVAALRDASDRDPKARKLLHRIQWTPAA